MKTIRIIFLTTIMSLTGLGLGEASDIDAPLDEEQCLELAGFPDTIHQYGTSLSPGGWTYVYWIWIAYPWWYRAYYNQGYCDVKYGIVTCYTYGGGW